MSQPEYDKEIQKISSYIHCYQINSPVAWKNAKSALLDALGCAVESLNSSKEVRQFVGPIITGTSVPNGFRLPGTADELDPLKGSFDLGSMIRYLDHNDAYPGAEWGHPSGMCATFYYRTI
jgi:2-methylcitrate dehydratase